MELEGNLKVYYGESFIKLLFAQLSIALFYQPYQQQGPICYTIGTLWLLVTNQST